MGSSRRKPCRATARPTRLRRPNSSSNRADKEDSGRGLEFVALNLEVGPEYLGLHTLKADHLVDSKYIDSKGAGLAVGAGLGVRLLAFTVGARFRYANFSDWALWTLGAEAGMHIPLGPPRAVFHARCRLRFARLVR